MQYVSIWGLKNTLDYSNYMPLKYNYWEMGILIEIKAYFLAAYSKPVYMSQNCGFYYWFFPSGSIIFNDLRRNKGF